MWPFSKKEPVAPEIEVVAQVQSLVVPPSGPRKIDPVVAINSTLRRRHYRVEGAMPPKLGMWVRFYNNAQHVERTGILVALEEGDIATVTVVDDVMGENDFVVHIAASKLRQCWLEEIPSRRRPDEILGASLGYVTKP